MKILYLNACIILLTGTVLTGCNPFTDKEIPSVDTLYNENCASCHGFQMEGVASESLLDNRWKFATTDEELAEFISRGLIKQVMHAFGDRLTAQEIRTLVVYIREKVHQATMNKANLPKEVSGRWLSQYHSFKLETWSSNTESPWALAFLPNGSALLSEKYSAKIKLLSAKGEIVATISGTPKVLAQGQSGMLDIAIHPDYEENGWVYLSYVDKESNGKAFTKVVRGHIKENRWVDEEVIFEVDAGFYRHADYHMGSRFVFDKQGYLYFTVGELGLADSAQKLDMPNGKVYRLHDDGRIPKDNPFINKSAAISGIYSYGHRNPQGLDIHPKTDELWEAEHGPRGGDELNILKPKENYGWPLVSLGMKYNGQPQGVPHIEGMRDPVYHWTPSIAVSGIHFYRGDMFSHWKYDLLIGSLAANELWRFRILRGKIVERELMFKGLGRIREVVTGPDGAIYLVMNGVDHDQVLRMANAE